MHRLPRLLWINCLIASWDENVLESRPVSFSLLFGRGKVHACLRKMGIGNEMITPTSNSVHVSRHQLIPSHPSSLGVEEGASSRIDRNTVRVPSFGIYGGVNSYGSSEGTPSERGIRLDNQAALDFVLAREDFRNVLVVRVFQRILVYVSHLHCRYCMVNHWAGQWLSTLPVATLQRRVILCPGEDI